MKYLKSVVKRLVFSIIMIIIVPALTVTHLVSVALFAFCIPLFWILTGKYLMDECDFLSEGEIILLPVEFFVEKLLN